MNKYIWDKVLELVKQDLPTSIKVEVIRHYLLPRIGREMAIVELEEEGEVEGVERPTAEEIELENNPARKAGDRETEKLMRRA